MCSVPSRLTATLSPYQTFQRQRGWLQALSGWSWNSSNHLSQPQARQSTSARHQQQGIALCLSICTLKKVLWNFHSHKGHIFPPTSARPILISLALPLYTSLTTSWCCATYPCAPLPSGIRMRGSWRSHKNTLGRSMPVWQNTSPGFAPLSANNPHSLTSIWAPNDTWRRGLTSKYWECSWVGKAGFYQCPSWHWPKVGWLKDFLPQARASFLWYLGICTASYEHYVQRQQIQLVPRLLIKTVLWNGK